MNSDWITVYIGTYTRRESFVDGKAAGIYICHLHQDTGALTYASTVSGPGTINPSYLTLGADNRCLYAVNEITGDKGEQGTLNSFAVDPVTKHLRYLNQQSTHGLAPCHASIEPEGRYCLVANYATGNICVLPVGDDGRLGEATDVVQFSGSGPHRERQEGSHAHMVVPSPDGRIVLAVDLGADRLMCFHLNRERGTLSPVNPPWISLPAGSGPRHLAFHAHRPFAYVVNELQSTITALRYANGVFEAIQTISTLPDGFAAPNLGAAIKVAPSGRFVYASNRGHDSMAIYALDQETGRLSPIGHIATGGVGPRDFAFDPSGTLLLVANQDTDTVATFWVDQHTGTLLPTGHVAVVPTPVCLYPLNA